MCLMGSGSQSASPVAPPPAPVVQAREPEAPEMDDARQREMDRRRSMMGPSETIVTGGRGLETEERTGAPILGA